MALSCADHYGLGHYGHYFVSAAHYDSYDHLAFSYSVFLLGLCYLGAQLNPLYLINSIEEQHL